uniref:Uncharacterized protein n=1 Tax=Quercus lobata TaxID=97700 RepID=A0A7N2L0N9_QUELO
MPLRHKAQGEDDVLSSCQCENVMMRERSHSAMEAKQQNGASLIVPLMHNENHHEQPDVKSHNIDVQNTSKSNTTSVVGTCFNGINALSGYQCITGFGFC